MDKRWYKLKQDRMVAGVISGLSWYCGIHPIWLRGIVLVLLVSGAIVPSLFALLATTYIAAIFVLPDVPPELEPQVSPWVKGLTRPLQDRMVSGVCAGIAKFYKLDVHFVRIATVLLAVFGGVGIAAYGVAWMMMPSQGKETSE